MWVGVCVEEAGSSHEGDGRAGEGAACASGRCQHCLPIHVQAFDYHVWYERCCISMAAEAVVTHVLHKSVMRSTNVALV